MITEAQMEDALRFLAESDQAHAELKTNVERAEYMAKKKKAAIFTLSEGTVADRQAASETSDEYQLALGSYFTALQDYNTLNNKRATRMILIDVWRSVNASMRRGNI